MIVSVVLTAFVLVAPVELPDKTMFATLVLASPFRPLPVLTGVGAALAAQTTIAVAAGSLLALLPREWVAVGIALLFLVGAVLLWRSADQPTEGAAGDGDSATDSGSIRQANGADKEWPRSRSSWEPGWSRGRRCASSGERLHLCSPRSPSSPRPGDRRGASPRRDGQARPAEVLGGQSPLVGQHDQ